MKKRASRKIWKEYVPFQMCPCCGLDTVLLRLPGWGKKDDPRWYIRCYMKGWDRSPWFTRTGGYEANAKPHPRSRYARNMQQVSPAPTPPPEDPFFSLDTE